MFYVSNEKKNFSGNPTDYLGWRSVLGLEVRGGPVDVCLACIHLSEYLFKTSMEPW